MKFIILISIILSPALSIGQYFGISEVEDSIIIKNNVKKYIEFDAEDSLDFFKLKPHAYYGIYNKKAQIIEKNGYSVLVNGEEPEIELEFITKYYYDDLGQLKMWYWYDPQSDLITRVRVEEYDSLGNNFGYRDYQGSPDDYKSQEINKYYKTDHPEPTEIVDSLITATKKEYFYFKDESRLDTLQHAIEYYTVSRLDSTLIYFNRYQYPSLVRKRMIYDKSNLIIDYLIESYDSVGKIKDRYRTLCFSNGLPKEKYYMYYYNGKEYLTHTKFNYEFHRD